MEQISLRKRDLDYIVTQLAERLKEAGQRLLNTKEKAQQLGIKPNTLRKLAREGKIDCIKRGDNNQAKLYFTFDAKRIY